MQATETDPGCPNRPLTRQNLHPFSGPGEAGLPGPGARRPRAQGHRHRCKDPSPVCRLGLQPPCGGLWRVPRGPISKLGVVRKVAFQVSWKLPIVICPSVACHSGPLPGEAGASGRLGLPSCWRVLRPGLGPHLGALVHAGAPAETPQRLAAPCSVQAGLRCADSETGSPGPGEGRSGSEHCPALRVPGPVSGCLPLKVALGPPVPQGTQTRVQVTRQCLGGFCGVTLAP